MLAVDDGRVRFKILRALGGLRLREPSLPLDNPVLRRGIERTLARSLRVIDWRTRLERAAEDEPERMTIAHELLVQTMIHKERGATERIFRLLGLLYPEEAFERIYRGFESQDVRTRASSFELLEAIVPPPLNAALLAFMDHIPDRERIRRGEAYYTPRDRSYEEILEAFLREGSVGLRCITLYQIADLKLKSFRSQIEARRELAHEIEAPIVERALRALDDSTPGEARTV